MSAFEVEVCGKCYETALCTYAGNYLNRFGEIVPLCNKCLDAEVDDETMDLIYEKAQVGGPPHIWYNHEWWGLEPRRFL